MAYFEKNKNGKWLVMFYCKDHKNNNKQIKKRGFKTKKEAQDYVNMYLEMFSNTENITLKTLIKEYLKYKHNVKFNTVKRYKKNIKYTFQYFNEDVKINEIKEKMALNFLLTFNNRPATQKDLKQFLSSIFDYAITYHNFKNNPFKKIKIENKKASTVKDIYTLDDFKKLDEILQYTSNLKTRAYFNLLFFSGARPGEISALTLNDIDFNNNTININKTRLTLNKTNSPKNKSSNRVVSIPQKIMNILKEYTEKLPKLDNVFIFGVTPTYNQALNNIIIKNNLKYITLHSFRHSHASLLIKKGIAITDISRRLGHTNSQITLQVYSHFYKENKDSVIDLLENLE